MEKLKLENLAQTMETTVRAANAFDAAEKAAKAIIVETLPIGESVTVGDVVFSHSIRENPGTAHELQEAVSDAERGAVLSKMGLPEVMAFADKLAIEARKATSVAEKAKRGPTHVVSVSYLVDGKAVSRNKLT